MGTTGTMMGTGGYLKERNPQVRIIAGDPAGEAEAARDMRAVEPRQ